MSHLLRAYYVFGTIVAASVLALLYAEAALPLIDMGSGSGELTGPFSSIVTQVETVIPAIIGLVLLGALVYQIYGSVQEERGVQTVQRGRRPPRR